MEYLANAHRTTSYTAERPAGAMAFHRRLPGYEPRPLRRMASLEPRLGTGAVYLKDESLRFGLPAFKVLGASWAGYRVVCERLGREPEWSTLDELRTAASALLPLSFVTATDGNHGRAVARTARWLGFGAEIFVPAGTAVARIDGIASEGATVTVVDGSYDDAVAMAASRADQRRLVISDTSWPGYETIPAWIAEGYETIFAEADAALPAGERFDAAIIPIGVGALAVAAAVHYATDDVRLLGVEPFAADCVYRSIRAGEIRSVDGPQTSIMAGLNCGTPSLIAWPHMRDRFDGFAVVEDRYAREAMRLLAAEGIVAGETGASSLAGLLALADAGRMAEAGIGSGARVLLTLTEGATDPDGYRRIVELGED